jgi:hypothetical protein
MEDLMSRKTGALLFSVSVLALSLSLQAAEAAYQNGSGEDPCRAAIASFSLVQPVSPREPEKSSLSADAAASASQSFSPRPLVAAAEAAGINVLIWMAAYVNDAQHAFISNETMADSFKYWFEWDPNQFRTNFLAHPYHGSLYFNAARSNGLSYWQSGLYSLGGSFMWETLMERHRPSINDLIMTTTGGMFLGEAMFRYTSLLRNENARGFGRIWRGAVSALLDPSGAVNRLIFGDQVSTASPPSGLSATQAPLRGSITLGGQAWGQNADLQNGKTGPSADFLLVYGTPFTGGQPRQPFDYFPVEFSLRFNDNTAYGTIYGYGLLFGKELEARSSQNHLLGLFQNYDYIRAETIELGGSSLCGGLVSRFELSQSARLTLTPQLGWMILGASNNEYVLEDKRDYNYGTGVTAKLDSLLDLQKYGNLLFRWGHYTIYVLEGAKGTERLNVFLGEYRIPVWKQVMLGVQYSHYRRSSDYRDYPDVKKFLYGFRAQVSYGF